MEHFNLGQNLLVNFCLSVEVSFATSKTGFDLKYDKLCMGSVS